MPDFRKQRYDNRNDNRNDNRPQSAQQQREPDVDEENVVWAPTPEGFLAFQKRDQQLASANIRLVLASRAPASLKELKDSTLHSPDVIERVMTSGVADGSILETKGKYSLAPRVR